MVWKLGSTLYRSLYMRLLATLITTAQHQVAERSKRLYSRWSDLMIYFPLSLPLSLSLFLVQDESTVQTEGLNAVTRK